MKLNTNLSLETVNSSKKLQEIRPDNWRFHIERGSDYIISIADVLDNAEMLFGGVNISNRNEPPRYPTIYQHKTILEMCINDKPLKEIEEYIIKNLK